MKLLESESSWSKIMEMAPEAELYSFRGEKWRRTHRLLIELAAFDNQIPFPLRLKGLWVNVSQFTVYRCGTVYTGLHKGKKVIVKRMEAFGTTYNRAQAIKLREVSAHVSCGYGYSWVCS